MGFMDDMVCGLYKHLCDDELSTNRNFGLRKIILLRLGSNFNVTYVEVRMARYVKFICYINYSAISKRTNRFIVV